MQSEFSPQLSLIVPVYNESSNLDLFYERVLKVLKPLNVSYEILFIDDGSKDDSLEKLLKIRGRDSKVKVVQFSRNFGKEIAVSAGLDLAEGKAVIPIDADLQDPPELIPSLLEKWKEGYDIVYAKRTKRMGESWLKQWTASLFYRLIAKMTNINIPEDAGDYRLLSRAAVEQLKRLRERHRFMKGLFTWVGFKQTAVFFERDPRYSGKTKWSYWKLWNFAIEGITSFSYIPLQAASYLGLLVSGFAFFYGVFIIVFKLLHGIAVPGYASLMAAVLFLGGVQLLTLGILGEYIGRIYDEVKQRPLYVIHKTYGFDNPEVQVEKQ
ncbi:MAG: glycosyltransferase family 2 protein [Firmicutes bacterium]|nr:glycosyltransferase family 2 protein [Bacillota bacterium]